MDEDNLTLEEVRFILVHGALYRIFEDDPRGLRYAVRGAIDGRDIEVICRFLPTGKLLIITVYAVYED